MRTARDLWPATFQQWVYNEVRSARFNFWNALQSGDPARIIASSKVLLWQARNCTDMAATPPTECSFIEAEEITFVWLHYIIGLYEI
jgi:hypothetical protein